MEKSRGPLKIPPVSAQYSFRQQRSNMILSSDHEKRDQRKDSDKFKQMTDLSAILNKR